jgi:hypothetical protein
MSKLFHRLRRQPPEEARKKTERRTSARIADHASVRGGARVPPLDACSNVPLHVGGVCLLLVFHAHIHRPLPHELR